MLWQVAGDLDRLYRPVEGCSVFQEVVESEGCVRQQDCGRL
jgi:hypothetical protein